MRRVLALAVALGLATAAPARAEQPKRIADGRGATGLSAYGGHLVWSSYDEAQTRWRLLHWHAGRTAVLPVPDRSVPFDADVGPDADGHPVVLYSACIKEAAPRAALQARGCRIMQLRLDTPSVPVPLAGTAVPGTSATTPSRWRETLVFSRHADRADDETSVVSTLVRRAGAGATKPMRTPAVLCEIDCDDRSIDTTIEALDVGPRAAAYLWRQDGGDTYGITSVWNLAVAPLRGGPPRVLSGGFVDGACGYVFPFAPTAVGDGAFWVAAGSTCDRTQTAFGLESARSRRLREAKVSTGLIFGATRDGSTVYWLRAPRNRRNAQLGFDDLCARSACTIVRSRSLSWRTLKRGRSPGPYPESS